MVRDALRQVEAERQGKLIAAANGAALKSHGASFSGEKGGKRHKMPCHHLLRST